jgi:hypothetical protein
MYLAGTGFDSKGAASGVRARHRVADSLAPCVIGSHRSAYDPSTSQLRGGASFPVLAQGDNPAAGAYVPFRSLTAMSDRPIG